MQNFNDRLLFIVDHVVGKLGLVSAFLDRVVMRMVPQATAMAQGCPTFCGYTECSGVCGGGSSKYLFDVCSESEIGCERGFTWTVLVGCDC
jgi:hypothetical protein